MLKIKIFGSSPPCAKCKEAEKRAKKVAEKYPGKIEVVKFEALSEEDNKYGVLLTPTTIVNEKVVSTGSILSEDALEEIIKKEISTVL